MNTIEKIKRFFKVAFCRHDFSKFVGCTFENGTIMGCTKCKTTIDIPRVSLF